MPDKLRAALRYCHRMGGMLGSVKEANGHYRLLLYRVDGREQARFDLTWPEFFEAFDYWQRIEHPGTGHSRESAQAA